MKCGDSKTGERAKAVGIDVVLEGSEAKRFGLAASNVNWFELCA
jgi:hypothetical protein